MKQKCKYRSRYTNTLRPRHQGRHGRDIFWQKIPHIDFIHKYNTNSLRSGHQGHPVINATINFILWTWAHEWFSRNKFSFSPLADWIFADRNIFQHFISDKKKGFCKPEMYSETFKLEEMFLTPYFVSKMHQRGVKLNLHLVQHQHQLFLS